MKSIADEIYMRILKENREFSSQEVLREFFKIDTNDDEVAHRIVEPILSADVRFKQFRDNRWIAVKIRTIEQLPVVDAPFIMFYIDDIEDLKRGVLSTKINDKLSKENEHYSFFLYRGGMAYTDITIKELLKQINRYIFIPYDFKSLSFLKKIYRTVSPLKPEIKTLSIASIMLALFPEKKLKTWDDIIHEFSIVNLYSSYPLSKVKTLMYIFECILNIVPERGIRTVEELIDLSNIKRKDVDFSKYGFDRVFLKDIPEMPGVYLFYNREGEVIYVGKTSNLKMRIYSYFWNTGESVEKIGGILNSLHKIEYRILGSDLEALIEEYKLIDRYRPPFNKKLNIPERLIEVSDRILVVPAAIEGFLKLYFLSNKISLVECDFEYRKSDLFVFNVLKRINANRGYVFDPLKTIAISYMKRYEDNINIVDIDRYADHKNLLEALNLHWKNLNEIEKEKTVYI